LRIPWYSRDHGPTPDQQACAAQWTSTATPPAELPGEQAPVDTWCEEVDLVNVALTETVLSSTNLASGLLSVRMTSPLTSDLGPLHDGLWGPTADAVLTWRATCNCWQQRAPFAARAS
jgi:hypothetical protein